MRAPAVRSEKPNTRQSRASQTAPKKRGQLGPLVRKRLTLLCTTTDGLNRGLGTMALEAYLRSHEDLAQAWDVVRLEVPFSRPWWEHRLFDEDTLTAVLRTAPDVLGLSLFCWDLQAQLDLAVQVKARKPDLCIVAGGPSATGLGGKLLEDCSAIDIVVRGEGEAPLASVLRGEANVLGVLRRGPDGAVEGAGSFGQPLPFDQLPSPLDAGIYEPTWVVNLEFARGCIYRCRFCGWVRQGDGMRFASRERIRADIQAACRHKVTTAVILDSALNNNDEHLERIASVLPEADPQGKLGIRGFVNASRLTDRHVQAFARMRMQGVEVSLNTITEAAAKRSGRQPVDRTTFGDRLERLAGHCPVHLHLILGLPGDTLGGFLASLDYTATLLDRLGPLGMPIATVFWLVAPPDSYYRQHQDELGLRVVEVGVPYVVDLEGFPTSELVEAARAVQDHRLGHRLRIEGPRALLEGVVAPERLIT